MCSSQIDKLITPVSSVMVASHTSFVELFGWCGSPRRCTKPETVKKPEV